MSEPFTYSKLLRSTSLTSWMVRLAAHCKFSNFTVALSELKDKVNPSVTDSKPDKSIEVMFLLLLTFKTSMVRNCKRLSIEESAVSDKVSWDTLAKPAPKLNEASEGKEMKDNCWAEVKDEKSMLCIWVRAENSKDPVTLDKPLRVMSVMDDELKNTTSPEITSTPLKSKDATSSPVTVISPAKVGHELRPTMSEEAEIVAVVEQESAELEAAATSAAAAAKRADCASI